ALAQNDLDRWRVRFDLDETRRLFGFGRKEPAREILLELALARIDFLRRSGGGRSRSCRFGERSEFVELGLLLRPDLLRKLGLRRRASRRLRRRQYLRLPRLQKLRGGGDHFVVCGQIAVAFLDEVARHAFEESERVRHAAVAVQSNRSEEHTSELQ